MPFIPDDEWKRILSKLERFDELEQRVKELEARLAKYENAHTPPSLKQDGPRLPGSPIPSGNKVGAPKGHKGVTRPEAKPDKTVRVKLHECPLCNERLGEPVGVKRKVVEEIPEPKPVIVTEFLLEEYECPHCGLKVVASHPDCPKEGVFGFNTQTHVTLLKYDGRLPHRKIVEALERDFALKVTPSTVLDINRRVSNKLQPEYSELLKKIRKSSHAYIDETGFRVAGKKYWVWIFVTETETLAVIRESRGKKVLVEVLGKKYNGIIICDGWKSYSNFSKKIQRCWAHLLREAKFIAVNVKEATAFNKALHNLYHRLTTEYRKKLSLKQRQHLWNNALAVLQYWLKKPYKNEKLQKFTEKIRNGLKHWLTFILHPEIEATNNKAERALREHVVQRKIIGCLRNRKGTSNHETIMSLLATWKMNGLNPQTQLIKALRS